MAKKALCVGINEYPYERKLDGCVNDAQAWAQLLTQHFDFASTDVQVCLDRAATRAGIIAGLQRLLARAAPGDVLVFTNSSHGTYQKDRNATERDEKYDQAICPYDVQDNLLLDDALREMFANLPDGVHLAMISDSCNSGTLTRDADRERKNRFLEPELRGDPPLKEPELARPKSKEKYPESGMKEILLSGCKPFESSYDAKFGDTFHGAMTYYALAAIRAADYKLTYAELHHQLQPQLDNEGFKQTPQLEGRPENRDRPVFT